MEKIKTKIRQTLYKIRHDYLDYGNIILFIAIILCLSWTYGSIAAMSRNWELAEKIATREKELALLQLEIDTLELENQYYASKEYQELAARRQQNKKLPGELMVYLPENSESAKRKHQNNTSTTNNEASNFEKWMSFLFGA